MRLHLTLVIAAIAAAACGGNGGNSTGSGNGPPVVPVYQVQGNGAASPMTGESVTVEGVVTGDFQDGDANLSQNLGGFYIQNEPDDDTATSDGVFVFDGAAPGVDVSVGERVRVSGVVTEHFGETQIVSSAVAIVGAGSIMPVPVKLPADSTVVNSDGQRIADLERYEGMLVRFPQTLTVADHWSLEQYGDVLLHQGGRPFRYTGRNAPDVVGYAAHDQALAARRIILDDGQRAGNVSPIRYLGGGFAPANTLRLGDQLTNVTGVLRYSRGSGSSGIEGYRLMPTEDPEFDAINRRPPPPAVGGTLKVASFNVLNFFSTIDSGANICGPAGDSNCRGADNAEELDRQRSRIVSALSMIDADIVGLMELENNASESLRQIVDALNARLGTGTYAFVDAGIIGSGVIKVGLIFQPANVAPVGPPAILDSSVDARFADRRNRPALAQTFSRTDDEARLTVVVNHLKSKGSPCDADGDPDLNDGQGNCNLTRTRAAMALGEWLATDPTASGDADALIVGDLNAYTFEDPLTALKNAGYVNLAEDRIGLNSYSFAFGGRLGALDHALASPSLAPQVVEVIEWHINADEPRALDYNLESGRDPALFDPSLPYRASDHDPLIIGLSLTQ